MDTCKNKTRLLTLVYNPVGDTRYIQMIESANDIKNGDTRDITACIINRQVYYNNKCCEFNGRNVTGI